MSVPLSRGHVDRVLPIRLSADLINDGAENSAVAVAELRVPRVGHIEIESSILRLEQGQKTAANESFAIGRWAQMVRRVAAGGYISHVDNSAEGALCKESAYARSGRVR
jgi:hypothetical protein